AVGSLAPRRSHIERPRGSARRTRTRERDCHGQRPGHRRATDVPAEESGRGIRGTEGGMKLKRQPAGELRKSDAGKKVLLKGWVGRRRDLGELIFLNVRDRSGEVQVVFDKGRCPADAVARAAEARGEDVVELEGEVVLRAEGQRRSE